MKLLQVLGLDSISYIPPYSPDLMPLEEVFSKVTYCLKANDNEYLVTSEPAMIVKIAFCTITQDNCLSYISNSVYVYFISVIYLIPS